MWSLRLEGVQAMTLEAIVREIRALPLEERKRLISVIVDSLTEAEQPDRKRSLKELRGLGKEIWEGIDAQDYINRERDR
jgi:hypothetical protein